MEIKTTDRRIIKLFKSLPRNRRIIENNRIVVSDLGLIELRGSGLQDVFLFAVGTVDELLDEV
jgi:hypothetical protein